MSVVAEYRTEAPGYQAVAETLKGGRLDLEEEVACDQETVALTFWTSGIDSKTIEAGMQRLDEVTTIQRWTEQNGGQVLFRAHLPASETVYWERVSHDGVLLTGKAQDGEWHSRARFPGRETLVAFRKECKERGKGFSLKTLTTDDEPFENCSQKPTEAQRDLLEVALKDGYFDVPRGITLAEIADRFGISDQAASERLRRGLTNRLEHRV